VAIAARIGAELGADLLKIHYTGDVAGYRQLLATLFVPVIVLGGPQRANIREVLTDVHGAIQAGARGIAIGRNIWAHPTPARVIAAMATIIHGNGSVDEAMRQLE
jgi:DhnA family fructose-bisphosphate aldolase class Ia